MGGGIAGEIRQRTKVAVFCRSKFIQLSKLDVLSDEPKVDRIQ